MQNAAGDTGIGFSFDTFGNWMKLNWAMNGPYENEPAVEIGSGVDGVASMDFYKPGAPSEGVMQMGYAPDRGGFLEIHAAEPTFASRVRLTGTATDTGIVTMFGGPHGAVYPLLEMRTHTVEGGSFTMYNPQVGRTPGDAVKIISDSAGGSMEFYDESGSDVWLKVETDGEGGDMTFYDSTGIGSIMLSSNGEVGVGTTTPSYKLDVEGDIECTVLHETSDDRLKTNVRTLDNALDKVERLRGVSFEWNDEAESVGATPGNKQIGVLASEVEQVFPELVSTPDNGYKSVDYTKLTVVLIEAMKEMNKKIATLQDENRELTSRIREIETDRQ
jgi:hypothetical protein